MGASVGHHVENVMSRTDIGDRETAGSVSEGVQALN